MLRAEVEGEFDRRHRGLVGGFHPEVDNSHNHPAKPHPPAKQNSAEAAATQPTTA